MNGWGKDGGEERLGRVVTELRIIWRIGKGLVKDDLVQCEKVRGQCGDRGQTW